MIKSHEGGYKNMAAKAKIPPKLNKNTKTYNSPKLKRAIKSLSPAKKEAGTRILDRLNFMEITLDKLQDCINKKGAVINAKNGNGFTTLSENPAQKSYNTMIGRYNALVKTLIDMLPEQAGEKDDELMSFVKGG